MIIGNVAFYGATSGKAFINGLAGERFAVRNSGVTAVVEGIGDHGCEYMTGGRVLILGETGRNFGAGMSGGIAYVYNRYNTFGDNFNNELSDLEELQQEDFTFVHQLVNEHLQRTSSRVAKKIIDSWEKEKQFFVKVMPRDYKRVLEEAKLKQEAQLA
jgi:glutamate synthase (NADPH/NADH) large chain